MIFGAFQRLSPDDVISADDPDLTQKNRAKREQPRDQAGKCGVERGQYSPALLCLLRSRYEGAVVNENSIRQPNRVSEQKGCVATECDAGDILAMRMSRLFTRSP
jgi:hypothetical protein